jgi:hypothetical protein
MPSHFRSALENALDGHQWLSHEVLDTVARQLVQGLPATRDAAIKQVLQTNLAGLSVSSVSGDVVYRIANDTWPTLLASFAPGGNQEGARLRKAVQRAAQAYGFLGKRNRSAYNPWPTQPYCPWLRHTLRRRGDTRMDKLGRWIAVDTQSFHSLRGNRYTGCYFREYAMGTAMLRPSSRSGPYHPPQRVPDNFSKEHFWKWAARVARWNLLIPNNRVATFRAAHGAWVLRQQGLPRGFHVGAKRTQAAFVLYVRQRGDSLTTTEGRSVVRLLKGRFSQSVLGTAGGVRASAAAQTYFEPLSKRAVVANAWRPYWHARLVPMPRIATRGRQARRRRLSRLITHPVRACHPNSPGCKMVGQALVEACLVLVLLSALLTAVLRVGDTLADTQRDDNDSRLHAFAVDPGRGGVTRGAGMRREPGGEGPAVKEMRQAWHYADRSAVIAQVGVRVSAVFREGGARLDDRATQRALGRSAAAWKVAAARSLRLARRIDVQTQPVDSAWGRQAVSFDWLNRWSHVDVRRRRVAARRGAMRWRARGSLLIGSMN